MNKQLQILVGMAVFATLALAVTLGTFAFGTAQPVQAQEVGPASRSFSAVGTDGNVTVTIRSSAGLIGSLAEVYPAGFTYVSSSFSNAEHDMNARKVTFTLALDDMVTYKVTPSSTPGDYDFMGTLQQVGGSSGDVTTTVGGATTYNVAADGGGNGDGGTTPTMPAVGSVDALPRDPGAAAQITVKFPLTHGLDIDESIVLEVGDDIGVPTSIAAGDVSIADGSNTASPRSVVVETNSPDERFKITVFVGDMSDVDGAQNLMYGNITVTFRQEAGITNRTEGGSDDWFFRTSRETALTPIDEDAVYTVPRLIDLSSYEDSRGEEIEVIGKGFKNGTTVRFWRDENKDGNRDADEDVLCSATASGDDIAECTFTLSNPPFAPGKTGNYINAEDGRDNKATMPLPVINLEPSMSVTPKQGNPGDSINVQLRDFTPGGMVERIQFGRSLDVCNVDGGRACPSGTVGANGGLSFSFVIPNGITPGDQDLKIWASGADDNTTFGVGDGDLQLSSTNVLPNQRVSISASGFTKSSNVDPAWIGSPDGDDSCPANNYVGSVTLGGQMIDWDRVNDGESIEVTSGGTWSAAVDLPINSSTTSAGTRELKIVDCRGGVATVDLTFAEREVTMTPEEGGVGSEIIITGRNFPVSNDDGSDVEVTITYDADGEIEDEDVDPDALGNFTIIMEVPEDANIPSNNTVSVWFFEDPEGNERRGSQVLETFTHRVPQGSVSFSTNQGGEGSTLTITASGFNRYTSVDKVEFGDREITPLPKPSTDTNGNGEFDIRIPGSDPGIYIIRVEIEDVVATQTFTVVEGGGIVDGAVETILGNVISADALDRVFRFDNTTKMWEWYISDLAFASTNNLAGLSSGDLVYIKVTKDVTADVLGKSLTLTCTNAGTDTEDCWNLVAIP